MTAPDDLSAIWTHECAAPSGRAAIPSTPTPAAALQRSSAGAPSRSPARTVHAADDETVRIGDLPITDTTALPVAQAKGYFEEAGLKVAEPVPVRSWSALVEGFAAGEFNLAHLLKPIPVWMGDNKFPAKVLAWAHTNGCGTPGRSVARGVSRHPAPTPRHLLARS